MILISKNPVCSANTSFSHTLCLLHGCNIFYLSEDVRVLFVLKHPPHRRLCCLQIAIPCLHLGPGHPRFGLQVSYLGFSPMAAGPGWPLCAREWGIDTIAGNPGPRWGLSALSFTAGWGGQVIYLGMYQCPSSDSIQKDPPASRWSLLETELGGGLGVPASSIHHLCVLLIWQHWPQLCLVSPSPDFFSPPSQ